MIKRPLLVVVVGPTAVGKTSTTLVLADYFGGEIISADSRQFYKEMEIGTAKPSKYELDTVTHHFINSHSISEEYDAGSFARNVEFLLPDLFVKNNIQFMVGGSGLYIKSVCEGLGEMPEIAPHFRLELNEQLEKKGLSFLLEELEKSDTEHYALVDRCNPQRIVRALEVIRATGKTYSSYRKNHIDKSHDFDFLKIGLELNRKIIYDRIDARMDEMIREGLFEEAKLLYPYKSKNALQTVGYKEIFEFMDGNYDYDEAIRLLKRNSRRYAKRQMTWFRKDDQIQWFEPTEHQKIIKLIEALL